METSKTKFETRLKQEQTRIGKERTVKAFDNLDTENPKIIRDITTYFKKTGIFVESNSNLTNKILKKI